MAVGWAAGAGSAAGSAAGGAADSAAGGIVGAAVGAAVPCRMVGWNLPRTEAAMDTRPDGGAIRVEFEAALTAHQVWVQSMENEWTAQYEMLGNEISRFKETRREGTAGDRVKLKDALAFCLDHGLASAQDLIDAFDGMAPKTTAMVVSRNDIHRDRELPAVATRPTSQSMATSSPPP